MPYELLYFLANNIFCVYMAAVSLLYKGQQSQISAGTFDYEELDHVGK